jgi:hypothetical protein
MSTQTITMPALEASTEAAHTKHQARAGLAMSLATFAMAAASALQAVLYFSHFGTNARTDGFFVAFALYTTFGVFSQSLRLTSVPLLVHPGARMSVREMAAVVGLIAVPVAIATGPLSGLLAHVLAPGLGDDGRAVTHSALPLLGGAMILQLWAAAAATVLAIRGRFTPVAASYVLGALSGLVAFVAIVGSAGELTLAWSMLAMAVVTCGGMLVGLRGSGGLGPRDLRPRGAGIRVRRLFAQTALVLGQTFIYLAYNMLFLITLAFASRAATGDSTVLSYAYLYASYLVAGTSMALGMSRIPELTRDARDGEHQAAVARSIPQGFRYAILVVAPALALLIAVGAPLIHGLFPASLSAAQVHTMRIFAALLAPWTLASLVVNFLLPSMFALGRARLVNALAPGLVVLHVLATVVGSALFGVDGAVGAFVVAPAVLAIVLLIAAAGEGSRKLARELWADAARFGGLAAAAWGIGAMALIASTGPLAALVGAAVGTVAYVAGLAIVAQPQMQLLLSALRPAAR